LLAGAAWQGRCGVPGPAGTLEGGALSSSMHQARRQLLLLQSMHRAGKGGRCKAVQRDGKTQRQQQQQTASRQESRLRPMCLSVERMQRSQQCCRTLHRSSLQKHVCCYAGSFAAPAPGVRERNCKYVTMTAGAACAPGARQRGQQCCRSCSKTHKPCVQGGVTLLTCFAC
jgi:hypothetical protein